MLTVGEAREHILERISVLDPLELSVTEAHGCVVAEDVASPESLPAFASAAVDGYALRSEDVEEAGRTPVSMSIVGEAVPGRPFTARIGPGEVVRIMTGGALPEGADAVVPRDDVAVVGSSMAIGRSVGATEHIRPAGEDVAEGEQVIWEGQRLRGMDIGVLAAIGRSRVLVRPRPRVVVFSTGDELRAPGEPLGPGLVRDANSFTIAGMAREAASAPVRAGIVRDDPDALLEKVQAYLPQADTFVISGGLRADEDPPGALAKLGDVALWRPAMRPGEVLAVGEMQGRSIFGVPGEPVAAAVTFELFIRPALLKMAGRQTFLRPEVEGVLEEGARHTRGRETYLRARAWRDGSAWRARVAGRQGGNIVSSLGKANALAVLPSERESVEPGESVRLLLLEPLEGW